MLERLQPVAPPWDAIEWPPEVHLVLFIHRVEDVTPGVYAYLRDPAVRDEWKPRCGLNFSWEPAHPRTGEPANLFLLVPIDAGRIANRLSCDQDIAEDGFFSLAMIARFERPLGERGEWFYRRLFWECGLLGQVLYLEAEAAGARARRASAAITTTRSRPARTVRPRVAGPVSLFDGVTGRRHAADERTWLRVGNVNQLPNPKSQIPNPKSDYRSLVRPNSVRIDRASPVPSAASGAGQSSGSGEATASGLVQDPHPRRRCVRRRRMRFPPGVCGHSKLLARRGVRRETSNREHQRMLLVSRVNRDRDRPPLPPGRGRAAATSADPRPATRLSPPSPW